MGLSGLLSALDAAPPYRRLLQEVDGGRGGAWHASIMDAAKPFVLAALRRKLRRPLLVLVPAPEDARRLQDQLLPWLPPEEASRLLLFPEPDGLPYERLAADAATTRDRLRVLAALTLPTPKEGEPPLIVACGYAAAQKTMDPARFQASVHRVRVGETVSLNALAARWVSLGYEAVPAIETPGAFSRRGGLLDVFPPHADLPARIELFGDTVESIRLFDPATQRSLESVQEVVMVPARELLIEPGRDLLRNLDLSTLAPEARARFEEELGRLAAGEWVPDGDLYGALVQRHTLFDYLPPETLVVSDRPGRLEAVLWELEEQAQEVREGLVGRGQLPPAFPSPALSAGQLKERLETWPARLVLGAWGVEEEGAFDLPFSLAPAYGGKLDMAVRGLRDLLSQGRRVVVASQQAQRLSEILADAGIDASPRRDLDLLPPPRALALVQGALTEGWSLGRDLVLLTDAELFGVVKQRRPARRHAVRRDAFLAELTPGDYVAHVDHGIAKFVGVTRASLDEGEREYLVLQYAGEDRLYVPTDQLDRVSRYMGVGGPPTLTRLGTPEWTRTKKAVTDSARIFAKELLELYAAREVEPGIAFGEDTPWQQEMELAFPYEETPDQREAIAQVKQDMEEPRPMDRLVCGDVGYGKTEVAVRAAFKAVMHGMQVAVLVPTTVLAQQHYTTFSERLKPFPFRVAMLSRFLSEAEQGEVVEAMAQGKVDVCVGTHRMLQKDVAFKNLGLVIIDEEQRFGVTHKERLKSMRQEVDVLTLTATPIPRTLHMALSGVRDMSTIETPPEERLPIRTYVAEFDERTIREAILRERDRGGQVFFVHNRIHSIYRIAQDLQELAPEASVAIAHGRMHPDELERAMLEFAQGKVDLLVCTTIIQAGLDIPNANTLIVNDADKLGLAQLYQLRGRVGRSSLRAYAYLLYQRNKVLTETAEKRLQTILAATELGAGFRIAMKDLEIRGAGSILGTGQSGHIAAVGFDLYTRLLAEAVEELRSRQGSGRKPSESPFLPLSHPRPAIDLPLQAYIPEEYIQDTGTRLAVYQRLTALRSTAEVEETWSDLRDRFGPLSPPVRDLLYAVRVRVLAMLAGVGGVARDGPQVLLRMSDGAGWDREGLRRAFPGVHVGHRQVRIDTLPSARSNWREILLGVLGALAGGGVGIGAKESSNAPTRPRLPAGPG